MLARQATGLQFQNPSLLLRDTAGMQAAIAVDNTLGLLPDWR
jgi:hypothetical protein